MSRMNNENFKAELYHDEINLGPDAGLKYGVKITTPSVILKIECDNGSSASALMQAMALSVKAIHLRHP